MDYSVTTDQFQISYYSIWVELENKFQYSEDRMIGLISSILSEYFNCGAIWVCSSSAPDGTIL